MRARPKPDAEPVMRKVSLGGFQGVKDMVVVFDFSFVYYKSCLGCFILDFIN